MIRPFTCICMLLAGGSGLYLYQSKHRRSCWTARSCTRSSWPTPRANAPAC